jgi:cyclophilin family peptidyl-prolyl cis-trans isomerase
MKLIYFMCFHNYREKPSISVIPTFFSFRIIKSFLIQFQDEHESNGPGGRARNSEGQPQETELELDAERQSKHRNRKQTRLAETATSSSEIIIKRAKNYFDNILLSFF